MQGRSLLLLLKRSSHATSFRLQAQVGSETIRKATAPDFAFFEAFFLPFL